MDPVQIKTEARKQMHFNQPQDAVRLLQEMLAYYGQDAEAHSLLGAALSQSGNDRDSIPHFEQAVRLDPRRASYHFNLGMAYEKAGQFPWAMEGYRRAIEVDPNLTQATAAYYRLAPRVGTIPHPTTPYSPPIQNPPTHNPPAHRPLSQNTAYSSPVSQYGVPPIPFNTQAQTDKYELWNAAPQIVKGARFVNIFSFMLLFLITLAVLSVALGDVQAGDLPMILTISTLCVVLTGVFFWLAIALRNASKAAWTAQIVVSSIGLLLFPPGTIIHGYILSKWFQPETKAWFGL